MKLNHSNTLFKDTLIKAYYYIANADGKIDDKEVELSNKMIAKENIDKAVFDKKINSFENIELNQIMESLISDLKKLPKTDQIKILAYMSNIANADGFMDAAEWKMIYNIYKRELDLELEEIIKVQKQIPPFIN